jgi:hypothetical protein
MSVANAYHFDVPLMGVDAHITVVDGGLWRGGLAIEDLEFVVQRLREEIADMKAARYDRESAKFNKARKAE